MNHWPIGFSTGCFFRRSIFEVLPEIEASGFHVIEVCSFPKHLDYHCGDAVRRAGEEMRRLSLRPFSFHAPLAPFIDITALDDATRERAVQELVIACEAAAEMRVEHVVLHPGPEREGRPRHEEFVQRMRHASESLNRVAARCHALGVHLLLENMLPHLLFGHISDMLYLLGEIQTCEVGACLDTGHAFLAGEIDGVVHKLSGHLQLIHVNDNRGDFDSHLPPGEGRIDWPAFVRSLHQEKFAGTLILELSAGHDEAVPAVLARAQQARDYLRRLSEAA